MDEKTTENSAKSTTCTLYKYYQTCVMCIYLTIYYNVTHRLPATTAACHWVTELL